MSNIIEFNATAHDAQAGLHCWLCQNPISLRALFCHHCGSIQPVRQMDHFTRLGLESRIDIDIELLEKQYMSFKRSLDPTRFAVRGSGERGHAAGQNEALDQAYETLREPVSRGRYWLLLHEGEIDSREVANPVVVELRNELESAEVASQCDRIAQKAGQAMEQVILGFMQALRGENWQQASATLVELDGLESILKNIHGRRAQLASDGGDSRGS